jgi:hypothetical protein
VNLHVFALGFGVGFAVGSILCSIFVGGSP